LLCQLYYLKNLINKYWILIYKNTFFFKKSEVIIAILQRIRTGFTSSSLSHIFSLWKKKKKLSIGFWDCSWIKIHVLLQSRYIKHKTKYEVLINIYSTIIWYIIYKLLKNKSTDICPPLLCMWWCLVRIKKERNSWCGEIMDANVFFFVFSSGVWLERVHVWLQNWKRHAHMRRRVSHVLLYCPPLNILHRELPPPC